MDYEIDLEIDENALDVEWLNQPTLGMKYGRHWADCQKKVQQAEENLKIIRAELIAKINDDPETYLGEGVKATVANVEACYLKHKDHKAAKEQWIEAAYQLNIAEIAKKEISITRKDTLKNLVDLHGQNYFAGPVVPRDLSFEADKKRRQKEADSGVATKLKRRKI